MDAAERQAGLERTRAYVATLQPLLNLCHWMIYVDDELPENDDASASTRWNDHDWRAFFRFSDWYLAAAPDIRRLHLVHEMIHLHMRGIERAHIALTTHFSAQVWPLIDGRFVYEVELATDGLAMVIAPFLPLPPSETKE